MERKSGVLMPVSSLYGEYSIGSFGKEGKEFVDFLSECGFSYWQVLPFCMTDEYNSPYKSYSAFAGNPYFVDLETLYDKGLITREELEESKQTAPYLCEYDKLATNRIPLLKKASQRVKNPEEVKACVEKMTEVEDFCRFMAIREKNNNKAWYLWESEEYDEADLFAWEFIQYEFFTQWKAIKEYANKKGVKIIGDIPIYVSLDSSDVWSNKEQYHLDEENKPTLVAGVPPDYFCSEGQLWGNPLYRWEEMKNDGFSWWKSRIKHMSEMFDALRIDHFRGIESYWAVKGDSKNAINGEWKKGPGMELVNAIKSVAGETEIIAEDLGDITKEVYELVKESGFGGMRVFQFAFISGGDSIHKPHNYPFNCVAYTGTHDNNTLLGYLWELDDETRNEMLAYCNHSGDWGMGCKSIIKTILASHARLVILPVQDILEYGCDTRINTPGEAKGNWQYRLTKEQLCGIDRDYFKRLNGMYSR